MTWGILSHGESYDSWWVVCLRWVMIHMTHHDYICLHIKITSNWADIYIYIYTQRALPSVKTRAGPCWNWWQIKTEKWQNRWNMKSYYLFYVHHHGRAIHHAAAMVHDPLAIGITRVVNSNLANFCLHFKCGLALPWFPKRISIAMLVVGQLPQGYLSSLKH